MHTNAIDSMFSEVETAKKLLKRGRLIVQVGTAEKIKNKQVV